MKYSFIVPLYNAPYKQLKRLLASFCAHASHRKDVELYLIEDGSRYTAQSLVAETQETFPLPLHYLFLPTNKGPASARNAGADAAIGTFLVFIDADTALTADYIETLDKYCTPQAPLRFFGGTERPPEHASFFAKSLHHSMVAWLATGGIRGKKRAAEPFKPRTHNVCIQREAFEQIKGFRSGMRYGEDIDLALRMEAAGIQGVLAPELVVIHERKATYRAFFKQVFLSGKARVALGRLHPNSTRLVHLFPACFVLAQMLSLLIIGLPMPTFLGFLGLLKPWIAVGWGSWIGGIFIEVWLASCSWRVAFLTPLAAWIQLSGYGLGYLSARLRPSPQTP